MPSVEKPCFLLPHGCHRSAIYVCVPVDQDLGKKSSVLEALMEFDGIVDMPAGVSFDDFAAWSEMVSKEPEHLPIEDLVFVLKVSERLGAHNIDTLTKELATKFAGRLGNGHGRDWLDNPMLSLSNNLLQLVIRHMPKNAAIYLDEWPLPMQQALADSWVTPKHGQEHAKFAIPRDLSRGMIQQYLQLLGQTEPSPHTLSTLTICPNITTAGAAHALCSALQHHSAISHIDSPYLGWVPVAPMAPAPATIVFQNLPMLSCLTSLCTSAPLLPPGAPAAVIRAATEGLNALGDAISALQHLAWFHLGSFHYDPCLVQNLPELERPVKRPRFAAHLGPTSIEAAPPSLDPIIAALSTAPSLTCLTFRLPSKKKHHQLPHCSGISGPFSSLRSLSYSMTECIAVDSTSRSIPHNLRVLDVQQVPELNELRFENGSNNPGDYDADTLRRVIRSAAVVISRELRSRSPTTGPTGSVVMTCGLPTPAQWSVPSRCEYEHVPAFCLVGQKSSMNHFCWSLAPELLYSPVSDVQSLVPPFGCFVGLESVSMVMPAIHCMPDLARDFAYALMCELGGLAGKLTALVCREAGSVGEDSGTIAHTLCREILGTPLDCGFPMLRCLELDVLKQFPLDLLSDQLARLPGLQSLSVGDIHVTDPDQLKACFDRQSYLTCLKLYVWPVTASTVKAFVSIACGLGQLRVALLGVNFGNGDASDDWYTALVDLPARGEYTLYVTEDACDTVEAKAMRQCMIAKGATYVEDDLSYISFVPQADMRGVLL